MAEYVLYKFILMIPWSLLNTPVRDNPSATCTLTQLTVSEVGQLLEDSGMARGWRSKIDRILNRVVKVSSTYHM